MRVLLTGYNGFIGRSLIPVLEENGSEVIALGRGTFNSGIRHLKGDLLDVNDLSDSFKKIRPTHLIHLAWYTEHGKYWDSPLNFKWIKATWNLLDKFYASGGEHALVAGTCAEYDWDYGYFTENLTPTNPRTFYGIAKDATRRLSEVLAMKYETRVAWARIFFPYGLGENRSRLIPALFDVFKGKIPPFGVGTSSFRDLIHVSDVARALALCAEEKLIGPINISSGKPTQIAEIVDAIARLCRCETTLLSKKEVCRLGDPEFLVGNNEKLRSLGWNQSIELERGLQDHLMDL